MKNPSDYPHCVITADMAMRIGGMETTGDITAFQCGVLSALLLVRTAPDYALGLLDGIEQEWHTMPPEVIAELKEWIAEHPLAAAV